MDLLLFGIFSLTLSVADAITYTPIVQTESGPIRGQILETVRRKVKYSAFMGIPYGEAPIGSLRFKPPIRKQSWTDPLDAINPGSVCFQYDEKSSSVIGSEDCLFLNVFTPVSDLSNTNESKLKAVMVWIYGGGFSRGSSNIDNTGPDFLVEDDVIVVSFNYRLGPLGFLNVHHENATGNAGLKDQNLALKWVKKNIEKFGGHPDKVTIFGQSAGAVSVHLHILSDMSAGLFSKSISISGAPLCLYWGSESYTEAKMNAFILGSKLGIITLSKDTLLKGLIKASAFDIITKAQEMLLMPFRPTIESNLVAPNEEKFLSQCIVKKYSQGNYNKAPHMMGFTSAEAIGISEVDLTYLISNSLGENSTIKSLLSLPSKLLDEFVSNGGIHNLSEEITKNLIEFATDLFFVLGIDSTQQWLYSKNEHPIYYYRFSHNTDVYPGSRKNKNNYSLNGAGHAEDLAYLFYMPRVGLPKDLEIETTVNRYVRLMTNFAKYGNPTPNGTEDSLLQISWPDSSVLGNHLDINTTLTTGLRPVSKQVLAFEAISRNSSFTWNSCSDSSDDDEHNGDSDI